MAPTKLGRRAGLLVFAFASGIGAISIVACSDIDGIGASADGGRDAPPLTVDGGEGFDGAATPQCITAAGAPEAASRIFEDDTGKVTVAVSGKECQRRFELASTALRRDSLPESPRVLVETEARPSLQTNNDLFDALYQLAFEEAKENSVDSIRDGAFRNGAPLACAEGGCFETGRKWNYVWTRDTAYAANLGIGWVDPVRAKNSLDFKLSERREGGDLQIVQDTGSGGSYPVSSDRAVWSLGAREILAHLSGDARTAFRDRALSAMKNVIDHDRAVVFDEADGLYRGEQSFLDWREQTYPGWTVPDLVHIATSKSLSTNVTHLALLALAADLSIERGESASSFSAMRDQLREAIERRFWIEEDRALSTFATTALDPAPARRFDLLGTSLAVLEGVVTGARAEAAIAAYPTLPKGPPVIFPQQKDTAIYHNRAIWPFVTAYWVKAARRVGNDAAFDVGVRSLVRGAALNLSNMENLEVVTGKAYHEDGPWSGPVVNSQRQLWSVAGYIGMVHGGLFGVDADKDGLRVAPFVTRGLRRTLLSATDSIVLNNLPYHGKHVSIVVRLPAKSDAEGGAYRVSRVRLNGVDVEGGRLDDAKLGTRNLIEVELTDDGSVPAKKVRTITDVSDYRVLFAPKTPAISSVRLSNGKIAFDIDRAGESEITLGIYRDGVRVANDLPGTLTSWEDATTSGAASPSHCYTVESRYVSTGNVSQRANPACFWGSGNGRIVGLPSSGFTVAGGHPTTAYGRYFYEAWGDPGHTIEASFTAARSGPHLIHAVYGNGSGAINTGITCAVKQVTVEPAAGGAAAGVGYLVMPQRGDWSSWGDSSMVKVSLTAGVTYRVRVSGDARSNNMSAFAHFADYTGGTGGAGGAFNRVNIAELKVLALGP